MAGLGRSKNGVADGSPMSRPSTSCLWNRSKDVDARIRGHDDESTEPESSWPGLAVRRTASRMARLCPGHPRLACGAAAKTWMPACAGMTRKALNRNRHGRAWPFEERRRGWLAYVPAIHVLLVEPQQRRGCPHARA